MKPRSLLFSLVLAACLLAGPAMDHAGAAEIWNSGELATISDSSFPMLHGMTLVWQARGGLAGATSGNTDWEIFLCDLESLQVTQLTDDDSDDTLPQTDGEVVVWQKHDPAGGNRIFLHSLSGGGPAGGVMISPADDSDNFGPKIASGHVVWTSQLVTDSYHPGRIMLYEAGGQQGARVISDPAMDAGDPRIDGSKVFWRQQQTDGSVALWYYDLASASPVARQAPDRFVCNRSGSAEGAIEVLARRDGADSEIFLYSRNKGLTRVTDNGSDDHYPVISENHVAWVADGEIHVADITGFLQVPGLQPQFMLPDSFTARWQGLAGADTYLLDLSTSSDFSSFVPGYHDLDVGATTGFDISGLKEETTYYLRVRAVVNGEITDYSPTVTVRLCHAAPAGGHRGGRMPLSGVLRLLLR
ncbi:MAG TPA: hypothetical protein ENK27_10950 [Desulfobulbus sp.]|nr:hypothetical protein [Desulfobulbus sp.]